MLRPARPRLRPRTPAARGDARVDRGRAAVPLALRSTAPGRDTGRTRRWRPALRRSSRRRGSPTQLGVGELWLKLDTANPTHSFKDRGVAVAAVKAAELGLTTLSCSSTGNLANAVAARAAADGIDARRSSAPAGLEPEKLVATSVYGATLYSVAGTYDDVSRLTVELSFELPWGFVNAQLRSYYAEGSKTIGFELAEQLGWRLPTAVFAPIGSGALYSKVFEGFEELRELGLVARRPAAALRRPG